MFVGVLHTFMENNKITTEFELVEKLNICYS